MQRSWIVFDDPPLAIDLVRTAQKPSRHRSTKHWRETVVDVSFVVQQDERTGAAASASSVSRKRRRDQVDEDIDLSSCDDQANENEPALYIPAATQITAAECTQFTQAHPLSRRPAQQSQWQRRQSTRIQGSTQFEESIISDSDGSIVDLPPRFLWDAKGLTPLDKLKELYEAHKGRESRLVVDCLVALQSIEAPRDVGTDKRLARLVAVDSTGATLTISLWGRTADAWTQRVRPGDVVWIGGVTVSEYRNKLQGSVSCRSSSIQLCYRTRFQGLENPTDFTFHRSHALIDEEAAKVIRIVDWFKKVYR